MSAPQEPQVDGLAEQTNGLSLEDDKGVNGNAEYQPETASLGTALASDPDTMREHERPSLSKEPSRSYIKPIPIVTTYEHDLGDNVSVTKRRSAAGSVKAPSVKTPSAKAPSVKAQSVRRAPSVNEQANPLYERPASRAASLKGSHGPTVGDVVSQDQQRRLQGVSLHDGGAVRPTSPFGHRPQPNLLTVVEDGDFAPRAASRAGQLDRSGTVISRANTLGRNGTLSRAANGGTVGSRRGAFGRGAGASIGTQPEEVLGRDDIHARAELSERILDDATLRRLTTMEKKDAKRLSKVLKSEGKAEAQAVKGSIKELERLSRLQKEAASAERKSQMRLSKYTSKEHKARLRFLKEKERYEKIEGELRNAENDYEERRDHAAGLTAQVAEKTQELDDLRGQKAADDREREVKLLALKNPGHS